MAGLRIIAEVGPPGRVEGGRRASRAAVYRDAVMIPVSRVMPDVLVGLLRRAPLTPEKVAFAWRQAVGPSVDRVTTIELRGDVLRVRAESPQWQREVRRSATLIRARLDALLGEGVVRRLDIA